LRERAPEGRERAPEGRERAGGSVTMNVRASRAAVPHLPSAPSPSREKKNKKESRRPVFLAGDVSRKVALDGRLILAASPEKAPDARCTAVLPWPAGSRPYFPVARRTAAVFW
jgi:hypothetical protein